MTAKLIQTVEKMKHVGNAVFPKYIDYIRFPFYKGLEKNTKISFNFPLTVFVGQNGGGKSSALQALAGAPQGYSVGNYWFSTVIDKIEESEEGDRPSLIYSYKDEKDKKDKEVIKTRIGFSKGTDYWEPSRPIKKYGMKLMGGGRNPAIAMNVLYIDFKSILSAFDKYFFFDTHHQKLKANSKQAYLRDKTIRLRNAIEKKQIQYSPSGEAINKKVINLSAEELKAMSKILGRNYTDGIIIEHKFFHNWGISVIFRTNHLDYSEAFAGSGEVSIATIVHKIINAEENSLILLDEPEVSLHPRAQKQLRKFLLQEIKKKKHQVVISTHSPNLIEDLPPSSIKVFSQLPNGKIHVGDESFPAEAFYFIGQKQDNKKTLIVEDPLAKELISLVIESMGEGIASIFKIEYYQGGASMLKKQIAGYLSQADLNKFIFFDGDQDTGITFDPEKDLLVKDKTSKFLKQKIFEITEIKADKIPFALDSDSASHPAVYEKYLNYWNTNVFFIPKDIPEELIWDDQLAELLVPDIAQSLSKETDYKMKFVSLTEAWLEGNSSNKEIFTIQKKFLNNWIGKRDINYSFLRNTIHNIIK